MVKFGSEEDLVFKKEYDKHKIKCSESFNSLGAKQDEFKIKMERMERAMFGDIELKKKGVLEMTEELYAVLIGSGFTFKTIVKILTFIVLAGGGVTVLWKLITLKI
jgi:hypothetical protein